MNIRHKCLVATALAIALAGCATGPFSAGGATDPLEGVWVVSTRTTADGESINPSGPGQYIFMDGYYNAVHSTGTADRTPSQVPFQSTDQEKIAQRDTIIVNAGTYQINGSQVTFRPMVALLPEFIGGSATRTFSIDGDTLTTINQTVVAGNGTSAPNVGGSMTLRRVR